MKHVVASTRGTGQQGAVSLQVLVLMIPVFLGFMGFAVDLGRLYLSRAELQTAAQAMASAAAGRLIGTDQSTTDAADAARRIVETGTGYGNKYDFGSLVIGETTGGFTSEIVDPTFYATAAEASGEGEAAANGSGEVTGTLAKHVRIELTGETPLTFWRFLSLAQEGKVAVRVRAAAGVSAPVCTACGIEPIAVAAIDATDTTDYGFVANTRYTLGYSCTGAPIPQPLPGSTARVPYVILNRSNDQLSVFAADDQQLFRVGAQGLIPSTTSALACFTVGTDEQIWATASTLACNTNRVQPAITNFLCGLSTRMDNSLVQGCTNIAEIDSLNSLYTYDSDLTDLDDYTAYTGTLRRIITIPIVDALNPTGTMNILAFRQFLVQPLQNTAGISTNDPNGRITASYIGSVMPLRQGKTGSCGVTGPGKVVQLR
ncbi:MAG: Tad domain-containing protein [Candidatus Solibacter usitatus]|nr:Tad domain-containing protein [Candidatus Solibacter usitatus]